MIESAEEFVRLRLSEDPEEYRRAANEAAEDSVWMDVILLYPEMAAWVAHNKTISEAIIRRLALLEDVEINTRLASKRKTPLDVLESLAVSANDSVRLMIVFNPKTPRPILERLASDKWERIREVAHKRLI